MVVDNEANLFGIEKVTAEEFQRWSGFLTENYVREARIPGMSTGIEHEGLVVGPQDINNFYFQAFLQRFKEHFQFIEGIKKKYYVKTIEDTVLYAGFFPKHPSKMDFNDYILFLCRILESSSRKDEVQGSMRALDGGANAVGYFKDRGWKFEFRCGGNHGDNLFYFTIDPTKEESAVFYNDTLMNIWGNSPTTLNLKKMFECSDNPFAAHETISFIAPFANIPIPLVNVQEFNLIHGYDHDKQGNGGHAFKTTTYSKDGAKEHVLPHDRFVI